MGAQQGGQSAPNFIFYHQEAVVFWELERIAQRRDPLEPPEQQEQPERRQQKARELERPARDAARQRRLVRHAPVGRHRVDRKRMCVRDDGKPAVTHYTVLERFAAHTEVRVRLETGRTHQIRVHFAHRRHALVGDPVYGGRLALPSGASERLVEVLRRFRRQALHAAELGFEHPGTGEALRVEAPLPDDFEELLDALREDAK